MRIWQLQHREDKKPEDLILGEDASQIDMISVIRNNGIISNPQFFLDRQGLYINTKNNSRISQDKKKDIRAAKRDFL